MSFVAGNLEIRVRSWKAKIWVIASPWSTESFPCGQWQSPIGTQWSVNLYQFPRRIVGGFNCQELEQLSTGFEVPLPHSGQTPGRGKCGRQPRWAFDLYSNQLNREIGNSSRDFIDDFFSLACPLSELKFGFAVHGFSIAPITNWHSYSNLDWSWDRMCMMIIWSGFHLPLQVAAGFNQLNASKTAQGFSDQMDIQPPTTVIYPTLWFYPEQLLSLCPQHLYKLKPCFWSLKFEFIFICLCISLRFPPIV